jgi:hypothetical protein
MTKQGQFQVDNFNSFHNSDLGSDLERIITSAESLYENGESLSISKDFEEGFDNPFGILAEDTTYWYANEDERDEDLKKLLELILQYLFTKYCIKDLTAKFYPGDNIVELFKKGELIHTEALTTTEDEWFGVNIDGKNEVDFNFSENKFETKKYVLTIYPHVFEDGDGFWHTDTDIFERIPLEIETK